MKKHKEKMKEMITDIAYGFSVRSANSACTFLFYQPKLPNKVKKLRRF